MIIGTGLIASAFTAQSRALSGACIYAAGVSNSSCTDPREFERERLRLLGAAAALAPDCVLVYFSTCSVDDPDARASAYVGHKLAMERLVRERGRHLILRLPQLVGRTPNPHTLLNYLYARIVRSERFGVWRGAQRNVIDVDDVVALAVDLIVSERASGETINVANAHSSAIFDIIAAIEHAAGRKAIFDIIDRGAGYPINTDRIQAAVHRCGISFANDYLPRIIRKYYGLRHEPTAT